MNHVSRDTAIRASITVVTLMAAASLLFARLGHYALWDDEAQTALLAEGVWRTGDTSAVVGKNLVAAHDGGGLENLKARYEPPLQHFMAAPFAGLWPGSACAVRLPFTFVGLLSVGLIFWWLWREAAPTLTHALVGMALIGNVSLWLYCRQCRYYSVAVFLSIAIAYLYLSGRRNRWTLPLIATASAALLAAHYLTYAGVYAALGVDWLIWGRKRFWLSWRQWLLLWLPQIVVGCIVLSIWNPLGKVVTTTASGGLYEKIILFYWAWRDLNRCEFAAIIFILAAPIIYLFRRDARLLRGPLALVCYIAAVTLFTPQKGWVKINGQWVSNTSMFDVRYLSATIPLLIAISALVIEKLVPIRGWWAALIIGAVAFWTNAFHGGRFSQERAPGAAPVPLIQSTLAMYISELRHPFPDPYTLTAAWINEHVADGDSILVEPDWMMYPLMYHAPKAVYAWQLPYPPRGQFEHLDLIHFRGGAVPKYVICFGPIVQEVLRSPIFPPNTKGELVAVIDCYWRDLYRPELSWRTFKPVTEFNRQLEAIYVLRLSPPESTEFRLR